MSQNEPTSKKSSDTPKSARKRTTVLKLSEPIPKQRRTRAGTTNQSNPRAYKRSDNRWQAEKTIDGKRYVSVKATQHAAEETLRLRIEKIRNGEIEAKSVVKAHTIDEWLWKFHLSETTGAGAVKSSTEETYRFAIETILRKEYKLTGLRLNEITSENISEFRHLLETIPTPRTSKPLSPYRRKQLNIRLSKALDAAAELNLIPKNPYPKISDANKTRRQNKEIREAKALRDERAKIIEKIKNHYPYEIISSIDKPVLRALFILSFLGIRPSEARGIELEQINLRNHTLTIDRQLARNNKVVRNTKTDAGTRTLPLTNELWKIIKSQYHYQRSIGATFLFTKHGMRNSVIRQQEHNQFWNELSTSRLYDNRHIAATILQMEQVEQKIINYILGWSSSTGTMLDIYGHDSVNEKTPAVKRAIQLLEKHIFTNES